VTLGKPEQLALAQLEQLVYKVFREVQVLEVLQV
jgi:hypothetical protein